MSTDPLSWLDEALEQWESNNLRRHLRVRELSTEPGRVTLDGQSLVHFGSNDYLGLSTSPALVGAARRALDEVGVGSGASPLITGRGTWHVELERALAEFEGAEAALLFPSGMAANAGTIASLVGKQDVVFSDAKNHASIVDGCRLSGARIAVYPHADTAALRQLVDQFQPFRRGLIVTDGLFSMDGDLAPLPELVQIAQHQGLMLMVDEAHATGVLGHQGRGSCELLGVEPQVHVRVGTLSKALGGIGGFVVGRRKLIDWLSNKARSYVFSTATPEALAAAGCAALQMVRNEPHRRQELLLRAAELRTALRDQGWQLGTTTSQIIPLRVGAAETVVGYSQQLREAGCFVPGIRPPSVPAGQSLLRISLTYHHDGQATDKLLAALEGLR